MMTSENEDTVEIKASERFAEHFFVPPAARLGIAFGALTHTGKVRKSNEDHYAVVRRARTSEVLLTNLPETACPPLRDEAYLMIVADGVGGAAFGELASRMVLEIAWDLAGEATSWVMKLAEVDAQQIRERVNAYVERMEARLSEIGKFDPQFAKMATTWTSAYVLGHDAIIVNIGDSRAYLCRDGECRQITRDHTLGQMLQEAGMEPARVERLRHVLVNCLGVGRKTEAAPELHHVPLKPGDRILLCTDGLTDLVKSSAIVRTLAEHPEPQSACEELVRQALEAGGHDNVTVLLAEVTELSTDRATANRAATRST